MNKPEEEILVKYKAEFLTQNEIYNSEKAAILCKVAILFSIFLIILDVKRYVEGFFMENPANWLLVLGHFLLLASIFPLVIIRKNQNEITKGTYPHTATVNFVFIGMLGLALLPSAVFAVLNHGSILPFFVMIIVINLFFRFEDRISVILNLVISVIVITSLIYSEISVLDGSLLVFEIAAVMILSLLISNHHQRLITNNFVSKKLLEEKNRTIKAANTELMLKALQSQMNPHFIFNTLNSIQHFLATNDNRSSMRYLSKFARLIRMIFEYSKEKWIRFSNEIEFLNLYLELEELRFENKVKLSFKIDPYLKEMEDDLFIPPLLIQPIIENAFKHGLMHRESDGQILVHFFEQDNCVKCVVEDNGVGIEQSKKYDSLNGDDHRSSALDIIKQRLGMYRPEVGPEGGLLQVTDLFDDLGEVSGTKVKVCVPFTLTSGGVLKQNAEMLG